MLQNVPQTRKGGLRIFTLDIESPRDWVFENVTSCLLCGSGKSTVIYRKTIRSIFLQFVKCVGCGLVYQSPRLTRTALASYFSSSTFISDSKSGEQSLENQLGYFDYFSWDGSYKKTARFRLERIARYKKAPARLLEIGTATGSFLDEARKAGYSVRGVDVSKAFAEIARKNYGLEIDTEFIEELPLPANAYDVICVFGGISCWMDPIKGFKNIRRSLKKDGVLVMNHPDIESPVPRLLRNRYPEFNHASLTIFSNRTIRECLQRTGFRPILMETERQYATFGRVVTYLKSRRGVNLVKRLGLTDLSLPLLAFGTTFTVCVPDYGQRSTEMG
jgi:SAM-dependent methyltransferase